MKKSIFVLAALFAATFANAQITLLHTFEGEVTLRTIDYSQTYPDISNSLNDNVYISSTSYYDNSYQELYRQGRWYTGNIDNNSYTLTFWDDNFQPAGTKTIIFPNLENYEVSPYSNLRAMYTTKLFNDDDDVEYLVEYRLTNEYKYGKSWPEYKNMESRLLIINQGGNIVYDFGTASWISNNFSLYFLNNMWLYIISKEYYDNETQNYYYQTEVYQISKQSPQGLSQVSAQNIPAYPNPTSSQLNIPIGSQNGTRQVNIYDMNGRLIETKMGNDNGEVINVNVSNYPAGNYIYHNGSNAGQFIKQ